MYWYVFLGGDELHILLLRHFDLLPGRLEEDILNKIPQQNKVLNVIYNSI